MSERRNFNELPKGVISEEQIKESEEINRKFMELPGIQETVQRLQSTLLSDRYRYYPQADVIINCLREVFGEENYKLIPITNDLLYTIGDFMDAYKALEEGSNDPEEHNNLKSFYDYEKAGIISYLVEYGESLYHKLKEENPELSHKEIIKKLGQMDREFVRLIEENLEYVPPKESNE